MPKTILRNFYGALGAVAVFLLFGFAHLPTHNLEITFLDVGQGDAILVRTPQNQKILIDAGPAGAILPPLAEELGFWERKIQLAILTHPDTDHIAGFADILKRYEVEHVLLTGVQHDTEWYAEILRQIADQKIPTIIADAEDDLKFGNVLFDILWPEESLAGRSMEDTNSTSIALKIIYGETAAMLTGDLDTESEKEVIKDSPDLTAQVFKLGHHGSHTSNSAEFLAAVDPEIVIVSASEDNRFGHPHPEVLELVKDANIHETAKEGSVKLISDGTEWELVP